MKKHKGLLAILFFIQFSICSFGQSLSDNMCNLYIDRLAAGDTMYISIKIYLNRNQVNEQVIVFKDEKDNYFAIINEDSIGKVTIRLDYYKINALRLFEKGVRKQSLLSNRNLYLNALAKYQIEYQKGILIYTTKEEFYSLTNDLYPLDVLKK